MYRYRLFDAYGNDDGEATYAVMISAGEEIVTGDGRHLHVIDVVPVDEQGSPFVGLLKVEPV